MFAMSRKHFFENLWDMQAAKHGAKVPQYGLDVLKAVGKVKYKFLTVKQTRPYDRKKEIHGKT